MRFQYLVLVIVCIASAQWTTEIVDSAPGINVGMYCSLALNSSSMPYISYQFGSDGPTPEHLRCANYNGNNWVIEVVDSGMYHVGRYSSIDITATGYPRISYYDFSNDNLKYDMRTSGTWAPSSITSGGKFTSLVLGSNDYPNIMHYDGTPEDLKYVYIDGGWSYHTVESTGRIGEYVVTAIDTGDTIHAAYYDGDNYSVKYAYGKNASWITGVIDASVGQLYGLMCGYIDIEIDNSDNVHVVYCSNNGSTKVLRYATLSGSTWTSEIVDSSIGAYGGYVSLAFCSSNYPHIVYIDGNTDSVMYVYYDGTQWNQEVIDDELGEFCSIAMSSDDIPLVAYQSSSSNVLKYAVRSEVSIEEGYANTDLGFSITETIPNPFTESLSIYFNLPNDNDYSISIYDLYGRHVDLITEGMGYVGRNELIWVPNSQVPNGCYYIILECGGLRSMKQVVLLR